MIQTIAFTHNNQFILDLPLKQLHTPDISWYWVDFSMPTEEEAKLLDSHFHFHPLAIEDCMHVLQRPKLDYYDTHDFLVLHVLNQTTLTAEELDLFIGKNYIVTFHLKPVKEIDEIRNKILSGTIVRSPVHATYLILDKIVDEFFPAAYLIEDHLNAIEEEEDHSNVKALMDKVFDIRRDLLKLRRIYSSMRDLLYRILNSDKLAGFKEYREYFADVYDHLLRLTELIESSRDMTADMRDSYLSLNSNRMNTIMMTLTIISSIFIPLTFIAGVYGMNFDYMPELNWRYGYFVIWAAMVLLAVGMMLWFRKKGWFQK